MRRVGYWISEKKRKKLDFEEQRDMFRNAGIDLIKIDLKRPLEEQGPFDVFVHKITDLFADVIEGNESSEADIKNIEAYLQKHSECVVLDPLESVRCILNRYTQYQRVTECEAMKDHRCVIPDFVLLESKDVDENKEKLAKAGIKYPIICKPILSHGPAYAHQMSIIFCEDSLKDVEPPCVAQTFINHNALLYKILVIGCKQFIILRPSLKNLYPGNYPMIQFDTQEVSKADSYHPLTAVDEGNLEEQPVKPDWGYLDQLGQRMRETMVLDLFGFDVIMDNKTGQYGVIDVNFFPGFETLDNFFDMLQEHATNVIDARDRGQLVNNRLLSPPHDPANVRILNQLNLNARTSHKNDVIVKGLLPADTNSLGSGDKPSVVHIGNNNNVMASKKEDRSQDNSADCLGVLPANTNTATRNDVSQNSCNHMSSNAV